MVHAEELIQEQPSAIGGGSSSSTARVPLEVEALLTPALEPPSTELEQLPGLAVRFIGAISTEPLPQSWPAPAAAAARRLQVLLLIFMGLTAFSFLFAEAEVFRALRVWHRNDHPPCDVPLRDWLGSHACVLALAPWLSVYCGFMVFGTLAGWAIWGCILLRQHAESKRWCDPALLSATWELIFADCLLFVTMLITCSVAACAVMVAMRAAEASTAWDPETGLMLESDVRCEDAASRERSCAICWTSLAEPVPNDEVSAVATIAACGHRFHRLCVLPWLRAKRTCPICRARADRPPLGHAQTSGF
mmetsp:Transcript_87227/g.244792  ORF Transcript_87227/g.244792 Transcript_87227/m.244792 type:complete len:305 (+) Transcript_87227:118-1032(+)